MEKTPTVKYHFPIKFWKKCYHDSGWAHSSFEVKVANLGHKIIDCMVTRDQKNLTDVVVDVHGVRRPTPPTLFDTVHLTFTLTGDIDDAYAESVIRDIVKNRCPLAATIGRASYLTWDHRILS